MDYLIFFFIFFIFLILIIYGLPYRNTYYKNQIADLQKEIVKENFKTSSKEDVKQGASTFYDWGLMANKDDIPEECDIEPSPKSKSKSCSGGKCLDDKTYIQNDYYIYPEEKKQEQPTCGNCEAYNCKNIDRYVLKSSVPPCPDMSEYALKSMVKPCPDLKNYVLKSEIPACPERPDLTKYVLKSQIPACPTPVVCPECPVCPPAYKYIQEDPRFKNWLVRYEDDVEQKINKLYIRKTDCNKKLEETYKQGVEQGKNNAYKSIAVGAGPDVLKKCLRSSDGSNRDENKKPSSGENINYLNDALKRKKQEQDKQREQNKQSEQNKQREQNKNRLADLEKKIEFQKNLRREENITKNKSKKIKTTSGDEEFVLGWDPTSLGFGSINYQMKRPDIK